MPFQSGFSPFQIAHFGWQYHIPPNGRSHYRHHEDPRLTPVFDTIADTIPRCSRNSMLLIALGCNGVAGMIQSFLLEE